MHADRKRRHRDLKGPSNLYIKLQTEYNLKVLTYIYCVLLYTTLPDLGIVNNFKAFFLRNWKCANS